MKRCILAMILLLCFAAGCTTGPFASNDPADLLPNGGLGSDESPSPGDDKASEEEVQHNEPELPIEDEPIILDDPPLWPPPEDSRSLIEKTANIIQATITMEDDSVIVLHLYPDLAPQSVRNFVYLARSAFYNGLTFHRIIENFMIQGGCPDGNGSGGPDYSIRGEFEANGFKNELPHTRGVLSMARRGDPYYDSAGSQFFIVHQDSRFLDGSYAAFGRVADEESMEVVDRLSTVPVLDGNGTVADDDKPVIRSITIDSDENIPEPNRIT